MTAFDVPNEASTQVPASAARLGSIWRIVRIVAGVLLMALAALGLWFCLARGLFVMDPDACSSYEYEPEVAWETPTRPLSSVNSSTAMPLPAYTLSLIMVVILGIGAAGAWLAWKRYSLRALIAFCLLAGVTGSVPLWYLSIDRHRSLRLAYKSDRELTDAQIEAIRASLQPDAAMSTLPNGFLKELGLRAGEGLQRVRVERFVSQEGKPGVSCCLTFDNDSLSNWSNGVLLEFYQAYLPTLGMQHTGKRGPMLTKSMVFSSGALHGSAGRSNRSLWKKYESEWENTREQNAAGRVR